MIIYCSPNRETVRTATNYHAQAWRALIYGKECYIIIVIYVPSFQSQINPENRMSTVASVHTTKLYRIGGNRKRP